VGEGGVDEATGSTNLQEANLDSRRLAPQRASAKESGPMEGPDHPTLHDCQLYFASVDITRTNPEDEHVADVTGSALSRK
uniref:hypothetical protein n=1 Tax=Dyella sp. EPa41 TaxID=1561194 RepID=UPI001F275721